MLYAICSKSDVAFTASSPCKNYAANGGGYICSSSSRDCVCSGTSCSPKSGKKRT